MDFPSNSLNPAPPKEEKPEKEKVEKVISGTVVHRKKPLGRRMQAFLFGDGEDNVLDWVVNRVLIPSGREMIVEALQQAVERRVYRGDDSPHRYRGRPSVFGSNPNHTNYSRYSQQSPPPKPQMNNRSRAMHDFNDLVIQSRGEAQSVIDELRRYIEKYGLTTVSDLYNLVGETPNAVDEKWGWTDLNVANVRRTNQGFILELPRTIPIED